MLASVRELWRRAVGAAGKGWVPPSQDGDAPERDARFAPGVRTTWETDAKGFNYYQSPSWYEYVGAGEESSRGENWLQFYHPEDRQLLLDEWTRALRSNGAYRYDIVVRIRRHDGAYRSFRVTGRPELDAQGAVLRWRGTCDEILAAEEVRQARSVLIADANSHAAWSLAVLVHGLGHKAYVVNDGASAIRIARTMKIDFAFVDLSMPGVDGYEVAAALRAELAQPPRLFAMSGIALHAERDRAAAAGFEQQLVKPIEPKFIESLLGAARSRLS